VTALPEQEKAVFDKRFLVGFILIAVVVLLVLPSSLSTRLKVGAREGYAPFLRGTSSLVHKVREGVAVASRAKYAVRERQELLAEIANLRYQVQRLKALERDNELLREQVAFSKRQEHELVLCEVLARGDTSGWWQTVRLNRGSDSGIGPDMAVVTARGLIGKTMEVSRRTSEVLLITDPNSRVSCVCPRTGAFGVLRGTGVSLSGNRALEMLCAPPPGRLDYLSKDISIREADGVMTSGLGGVYPEGLVVGRVRKPKLDASRLYRKAEVVLAADIRRVRYCFVLVPAESDEGASAELRRLEGLTEPPAEAGGM